MIVVMREGAGRQEIENVVARLREYGFSIHLSEGVERTIIGAIGEKKPIYLQSIEAMDGVEKLVPILEPYKLVSRSFQNDTTVVNVGSVTIGGPELVVWQALCCGNEEQLFAAAKAVKEAGGHILRAAPSSPEQAPTLPGP